MTLNHIEFRVNKLLFGGILLGHIYILPALPNVLVCGPFPRGQIVTRFNPDFNKMGRTTNVGSYLDTVTASKRFMGDEQSWNSFFMNKNEKVSTALKENVIDLINSIYLL